MHVFRALSRGGAKKGTRFVDEPARPSGFSPRKDAYDRVVWVRENSNPPTRTTQNNQYIAFRFNCTASISTRPGGPVTAPAVRGLDSSFIHRTAGANL